jgi:hypothetical protein
MFRPGLQKKRSYSAHANLRVSQANHTLLRGMATDELRLDSQLAHGRLLSQTDRIARSSPHYRRQDQWKQ